MWVIMSRQIKQIWGEKNIISFIETYGLSNTLINIGKADIQIVHAGSTLNSVLATKLIRIFL